MTLNCKIEYEILPGLKLFAQANNLLSKDYYSPGDTGGNIRGIPNRGQHFLVGVNKQF